MNIILDPLPYTVEVAGEEVEINWDFRAMMLFEIAMQNPELDDVEKALAGLELFYPQPLEVTEEVMQRLLWFYSCGKDQTKGEEEKGNISRGPVYSFEHDASLIYAAFLSQYRIDLTQAGDLHWWEFQALFKGLNDNHLINKIMGYRAMDIDSSMTNEEKKHYNKMKELYKLPDMRSQEEKEEAFNEAIAGLF